MAAKRRSIAASILAAILITTTLASPGISGAQTWSPELNVSATTGLDPDGQTITVTGTGFDPNANIGTRPPLAGQAAGVYVAFARVSPNWKPSESAPGANRDTLDVRWALPAASRAVLDPGGTNPDYVTINPDGSFVATLDTAVTDEPFGGQGTPRYAVITYPGSGAQNASQELLVELSFAGDDDNGSGNGSGGGDGNDGAQQDPPAEDTGAEVLGGELRWGVKESFRSYISGPIASGSAATGGGASERDDGTFAFPAVPGGTYDPDTSALEASFSGTVTFSGHDGDLDLVIADPRIASDGEVATLHADVTSLGLEETEPTVFEDVALATVDLGAAGPTSGGERTLQWIDAVTTLSGAGSEAFAGFYDPGTEMDPLSIVLEMDRAVDAPPAGDRTDDPALPAAVPTAAAVPRFTG